MVKVNILAERQNKILNRIFLFVRVAIDKEEYAEWEKGKESRSPRFLEITRNWIGRLKKWGYYETRGSSLSFLRQIINE